MLPADALISIGAEDVLKRRALGLAGSRAVRQEGFDGLGGLRPALLLHFVNPIGDSFHHIACCIARSGLFNGFFPPFKVTLLDYSDGFLF